MTESVVPEVLQPYLRHRPGCAIDRVLSGYNLPCDCGLAALLAGPALPAPAPLEGVETPTARWVICDGCGTNADCRILTPTLDGTKAYQLCVICIHNAARLEQRERVVGLGREESR